MTIDEAIAHCLEVAEQKERDSAELIDILDELDVDACKECAADHRQLADWLTELKERRAADVQPVEHSRWIPMNDGTYNAYCENCGHERGSKAWNKADYKYCPNCGARMDGEQNET